MRRHAHWPPLERALTVYSRAGEHSRVWLAIGAAGFLADHRSRHVYGRLFLALSFTEVANAILKLAFRRPRPVIDELPALVSANSQRSFPSAHASTSFAAARILSASLPPAPIYLLASIMAISRPYLGVHYPSDVVAGITFGTVVGSIAIADLPDSGSGDGSDSA